MKTSPTTTSAPIAISTTPPATPTTPITPPETTKLPFTEAERTEQAAAEAQIRESLKAIGAELAPGSGPVYTRTLVDGVNLPVIHVMETKGAQKQGWLPLVENPDFTFTDPNMTPAKALGAVYMRMFYAKYLAEAPTADPLSYEGFMKQVAAGTMRVPLLTAEPGKIQGIKELKVRNINPAKGVRQIIVDKPMGGYDFGGVGQRTQRLEAGPNGELIIYSYIAPEISVAKPSKSIPSKIMGSNFTINQLIGATTPWIFQNIDLQKLDPAAIDVQNGKNQSVDKRQQEINKAAGNLLINIPDTAGKNQTTYMLIGTNP